jgi:hypothetical protein
MTVKYGDGGDVKSLGTVTGGGETYIVELARWGITQGIPVKPYSGAHYTAANANCAGMNNALQYAYDNGYNHVQFPRGDYSVCYRADDAGNSNTIITRPNTTIDFNYSKFKVMFESDVRQPYDLRTSGATYSLGGIVVSIFTPNTHVINLTLIGDRVSRSFTDPLEKSLENTSGIYAGTGADKCSTRYNNISYFMADAISLNFAGYTSFEIGLLEFGSINDTGDFVTGVTTKSVRTVSPVTLPVGITSFTMIGLGNAPMTTIPANMYDVSFYRSDNTFISKRTNVRTRDRVAIPIIATKIKIAFEGDGTTSGGTTWPNNPPYWILLLQQGLSDNFIVEDNEIHRCHRGGLLIGTNNVTVQRNYFHDNAVPEATDIDGIPTFTDFTRYSINAEDNVGHNCKILNNIFDKTRMGIAIRGEFTEVSGNEFRSCTYGIILYYLRHAVVTNNYFHYAGFGNFDEYVNFERDWTISNNVFIGSNLGFNGTGGSVASITDNYFYNGSMYSSPVPCLNFRNNTFNNSTYQSSGEPFVEDCAFINNGKVTSTGSILPFEIRRSKFINATIVSAQNQTHLTIKNSSLIESGYVFNSINTVFTLIDCDINNASTSLVDSSVMADIGQISHSLELINCRVSMGRKNLVGAYFWKDILIQDTPISFNASTAFTKALHDGYGNILGNVRIVNSPITASNASISQSIDTISGIYVDSKSPFTNFSLINAIYQIQSDKMTVEPTAGVYSLGQLVLNSAPIAGGYLGWICVTAGVANNTAWTASTLAVIGAQINSGGRVYESTVYGNTGATIPTFPTTVGATVADGAVTWIDRGIKAVFKTYGPISA